MNKFEQFQEASVSELASVDGGFPICGPIIQTLIRLWQPNSNGPRPMTNFELLGITPPK